MTRTAAQALAWSAEGTRLFLQQVEGLGDDDLAAPSLLPGWTRQHVVGHVGLNAEALRNLATWARTGVQTPMYSSPGQRAHDIDAAGQWPVARVRAMVVASATGLADDLAGLPEPQWHATIRTAQGRSVPVTEVPWMRAREVLVHAVDLGTGLTFADLPSGFVRALAADISTKLSTGGRTVSVTEAADQLRVTVTTPTEAAVVVAGHAWAVTAWLAGRADGTDLVVDGGRLPRLGPWL